MSAEAHRDAAREALILAAYEELRLHVGAEVAAELAPVVLDAFLSRTGGLVAAMGMEQIDLAWFWCANREAATSLRRCTDDGTRHESADVFVRRRTGGGRGGAA